MCPGWRKRKLAGVPALDQYPVTPGLEREEGNLPAFLFQIDDQWRLAQREGKSAKIPTLDRFPVTPGLERKGKLPLVIFAVRWFQPDVSMWSFGLDYGIIENPAVSLGVILTHCDSVEWTGVSPTCPMSFLTKQFHAAECLESEQILFTANLDRTTHMAPSLCCYFSVTVANNAILFFSLLPNCV